MRKIIRFTLAGSIPITLFKRMEKVSFGGLRPESYPDRQSVVGFLPLGSFSAPSGSKPSFGDVSGRFSKAWRRSVWGTQA